MKNNPNYFNNLRDPYEMQMAVNNLVTQLNQKNKELWKEKEKTETLQRFTKRESY
jgi:hypothetical protein